jgi:hypothetical protein
MPNSSSSESSVAAVSFDVTRLVDQVLYGDKAVSRVRLTIVNAIGVSENLFVYQRTTLNPQTTEQGWQFSHVAAPWELDSVPDDEARALSAGGFYRLNYVDLLLSNALTLEDFLTDVQQDLTQLAIILSELTTVQTGEETWQISG